MALGTGAVTTTAADEVLVAVASACSGNPQNVAWMDTAGFAVLGFTVDTVTGEPGIAGDSIVTSRGTYADAWTVTYTNR
jgi:hypothetical protein